MRLKALSSQSPWDRNPDVRPRLSAFRELTITNVLLRWPAPVRSCSPSCVVFGSYVSLRALWAAARSASPSAHDLATAIAEARLADRHSGATGVRVRSAVAPEAVLDDLQRLYHGA